MSSRSGKERPSFQAPEPFLPLASLPQECEKELASLCRNLFHQSLTWSWDQGEKKGASGVKQPQTAPSSSNRIPHPQASARPWDLLVKIRAAFPHPLIPLNFCNSSSLLSWMPFDNPGQGCSSVSLQVRRGAGDGGTEQFKMFPLFFYSVLKPASSQGGSLTPQILHPPLPRSCTTCSGALYPADHFGLVFGQNSAASGSVGPRFLAGPDPEELTCE